MAFQKLVDFAGAIPHAGHARVPGLLLRRAKGEVDPPDGRV